MTIEKVFTEKELAAKLGLSAWAIRRWRLSEGLPVIRIGGRFLYRLESVEAWLIAREMNCISIADHQQVGIIREVK